MRLRPWILMLALAGPVGKARADEPAPPAAAAAKKPVRVGPTTVTVIDEQESVDDIISRVHRSRQERAAKVTLPPAEPAAGSTQQPPRGKIKARLRDASDRDKLSRKEARERAHRLRENLRERRANRLKGARAE